MSDKKPIKIRKCVGCMEQTGKTTLIRVIRSPESEIAVDFTGKKNGRGAYLCKNAGCLEKARRKKSLERALKHEIPDNVYNELEAEMNKA